MQYVLQLLCRAFLHDFLDKGTLIASKSCAEVLFRTSRGYMYVCSIYICMCAQVYIHAYIWRRKESGACLGQVAASPGVTSVSHSRPLKMMLQFGCYSRPWFPLQGNRNPLRVTPPTG